MDRLRDQLASLDQDGAGQADPGGDPPHAYIPAGPVEAAPYLGYCPPEVRQEPFGAVLEGVAAGVSATGGVHQELDNGIGDALIDVANSHRAGLSVVGTRGRSNIKSMLLGSVSHEVVCRSTRPVLVVPDKTG